MCIKMLKIITVCLFIELVYAKQKDSSELPSDIQKCHRGDNECIQKTLDYIIKNYEHGYPAINLPSLEPLRAEKFHIIHETEGDDNLQIYLKLKDVEFTGYGANATYTNKGFEKDIASSNVTINIYTPKFVVQGAHQLRLKFRKHPSHGKGRFQSEFYDIDFVLNFIPTIYTNDGKEYLNIKTLTVDYIPRNVSINIDGLSDGDKNLGDKENKFLNEHGVEFYQQLRTIIGTEAVKMFTDIIDSIFAKFPLDKLFLD